MPLPLILGIAAAIAGTTGVGLGIKGAIDLSDANDTLKKAQKRDKENLEKYKKKEKSAIGAMDDLGTAEINILKSLDTFSELFEKIHNRPEFEEILRTDVKIPAFKPNELKNASVGAAILAGGLSGAAVGTAGGFAAASATTAAVMALGTASTGTAISTLSGVAATNATLAALGGGSLAAGGGGMALGSTILGASTLGVGLLIGGIIFSLSGSSVKDKADKAYGQMLDNEKKIREIYKYLDELETVARKHHYWLNRVFELYDKSLSLMRHIIREHGNCPDWRKFSFSEKKAIENTVLFVGVIYNMCKVQLVLSESGNNLNKVNVYDADRACRLAEDAVNSATV